MSSVKLTGSMPKPQRIMGVLDANAKQALTKAQGVVKPIVDQEAPGGLGRAMTARVAKTQTGYRLTVQAPRGSRYKGGPARTAQVVRWVNRGTGVHRKGPGRKRPITSSRGILKPMILPGGKKVRSVKGQRPNPFIARAERRADGPVRTALEQGAHAAARDLRRIG